MHTSGQSVPLGCRMLEKAHGHRGLGSPRRLAKWGTRLHLQGIMMAQPTPTSFFCVHAFIDVILGRFLRCPGHTLVNHMRHMSCCHWPAKADRLTEHDRIGCGAVQCRISDTGFATRTRTGNLTEQRFHVVFRSGFSVAKAALEMLDLQQSFAMFRGCLRTSLVGFNLQRA